MTIHELAEQAGYFLPVAVAEKQLRHEVAAISASSTSARILLASELIKSHTCIELFWDEVVAFERGTRIRTLLEKRVATWGEITKPVVGRSSKRSYSPLPKNSAAGNVRESAAGAEAAWEKAPARDVRTKPTPLAPDVIVGSSQPSNPALKSIDEKLRMLTAMKALEMQAKMREMGALFSEF